MKDNRNHESKSNPEIQIGQKVKKISGKPFKSGNLVNTVKGITINPETGRPAFTFVEDVSNVEQWRCIKSDDI